MGFVLMDLEVKGFKEENTSVMVQGKLFWMRMELNNLGINMFLVAKRVLASKKVINRTMELGLVIIIAYLLQLYVILPMENNKLKQ